METITQEAPAVVVLSEVERLNNRVADLLAANTALQMELKALRATEDWEKGSWLMQKVSRQAKALNVLGRRVRTQRLVLGKLDALGRGLDYDEFCALKDEFADDFAEITSLYV